MGYARLIKVGENAKTLRNNLGVKAGQKGIVIKRHGNSVDFEIDDCVYAKFPTRFLSKIVQK